jgi:hypothetical protein
MRTRLFTPPAPGTPPEFLRTLPDQGFGRLFAGGTPPEFLRTLPDQGFGRLFAGGTPLFVLAMVLGLAMAAWA